MTDECREAFEKWCAGPDLDSPYTEFGDTMKECAWRAFQAAWHARRSPDASEVDAVLSLLENAASVDYDEVVMEAKTRLRALKDRRP